MLAMMSHRSRSRLLAAALALVLSGCSLLPNIEDETKEWPASRLYSASKSALNTADYETALKYLEALEARFPFGRYAQQAQLDIIYAYYKFDEPDSAIAAADRFIKLYPRHPRVDYAFYMRGLSSFNKGMTGLDYWLNIDPTQRDPRATLEAFQYFSQVVAQFPQSDYAKDAAQRLVYLHNNLARYEINVAEYYLSRGAYIAAANRAKNVIEKYQRTTAARDALVVMVRAYRGLQLHDLADDTLRVLKQNAPTHPALAQLEAPAANASN